MNKKNKLTRLDIKLEQPNKDTYEKERAEYIADYKIYVTGHSNGGFFGGWTDGHYEKKPDIGEAEWNKLYPQGFTSYCNSRGAKLTSYGEQVVVDKINEIINYINKQHEKDKETK